MSMNDDNWELIKGVAAGRIEILNYLSQVNQIEAMVLYSLHRHPSKKHGSTRHLNQKALKELHRTGTFLLLEKPGEYRQTDVHVFLANGTIIYEPPPPEKIEAHLESFFKKLGERWGSYEPVEAGAFTLWFINWVHPFKNGNGRSARAFCYATMAMRMGYVPPGEITVPELIKKTDENDDEYQKGLRAADAGYGTSGEPNLAPLETLLDRLLAEQLEEALKASKKPSRRRHMLGI
jgi:Fic family protein